MNCFLPLEIVEATYDDGMISSSFWAVVPIGEIRGEILYAHPWLGRPFDLTDLDKPLAGPLTPLVGPQTLLVSSPIPMPIP